jgi:ABC-2 type transport system ATP-binding protein
MIQYSNVTKSYNGKLAVNNISFYCQSGSINCLVGRNGSGKSTIINLASGLVFPNKGQIKIFGEPLDRNLLGKVGFVFEKPIYVEKFSALEQLEFIGRLHKIRNLKSRVNFLIDFFDLPNDKKKICNYSEGMKAKVSIACAIVHDPEIVFLDESFKDLDIPSQEKLMSLLKEFVQMDKCVLLSTHQIDVINEICDNICVVKNGEITFQGHISKLRSLHNIDILEEDVLKHTISTLI